MPDGFLFLNILFFLGETPFPRDFEDRKKRGSKKLTLTLNILLRKCTDTAVADVSIQYDDLMSNVFWC